MPPPPSVLLQPGSRAWAVKLKESGRHCQGCYHSTVHASVLQVGRQPGYWRDSHIRRALAADSGSVGTIDAAAAGVGEGGSPPAEQNGH
jgi:hypothetical protein